MLLHGLLLRGGCLAPETGGAGGSDDVDDAGAGGSDDVDDAGADDADDTDDAGADDADDTDDAGADDAEPAGGADKSTKRAETRHQRLANELKREREARIAAETRAEERERLRTAQPNGSADAARVRAEKLALMDEPEKREFLRDESMQQMQNEIFRTRLENADSKDEAKYDAMASKNTPQGKYYAKNKERVERELATARRNGNNPSREAIVKLLYADDAFKAKPSKTLAKEKDAAQQRVKSAQSMPTSARGDAGGKRGGDDSVDALRERILERERTGAM